MTAEQGVGIEHDAGRLEDWVAFESGLARSCKVMSGLSGQNGLRSVWGICRCDTRFAQGECVDFIGDAGADIFVWLEHVDSQTCVCGCRYKPKNKSSVP